MHCTAEALRMSKPVSERARQETFHPEICLYFMFITLIFRFLVSSLKYVAYFEICRQSAPYVSEGL